MRTRLTLRVKRIKQRTRAAATRYDKHFGSDLVNTTSSGHQTNPGDPLCSDQLARKMSVPLGSNHLARKMSVSLGSNHLARKMSVPLGSNHLARKTSVPLCSDQLARKMRFRLSQELVAESPLVIVFEELSDATNSYQSDLQPRRNRTWPRKEKATSIGNSGRPGWSRPGGDCSNNAEQKNKSKMVERVIGRSFGSWGPNQDDSSLQSKDKGKTTVQASVSRTLNAPKYKISGFQESSKFDEEEERYYGAVENTSKQKTKSDKADKSDGASSISKLRKDSARPHDAKFPNVAGGGGSQGSYRVMSLKEGNTRKISTGENVDRTDSDPDLSFLTSTNLTKKDQALKLLAEIQMKMDKRTKQEDDHPSGHNMHRLHRSITPQEALQCAWLRLSRSQIATLEELIRQQGKDPGIHAHSDVSNYDVFAEIREIRRKEKALAEEDEYVR